MAMGFELRLYGATTSFFVTNFIGKMALSLPRVFVVHFFLGIFLLFCFEVFFGVHFMLLENYL